MVWGTAHLTHLLDDRDLYWWLRLHQKPCTWHTMSQKQRWGGKQPTIFLILKMVNCSMPLCLTCVCKTLETFWHHRPASTIVKVSLLPSWISGTRNVSSSEACSYYVYAKREFLKISADRDSLCLSPPLQFPPLSSSRGEGVPSAAARSNAHAALHSWKVVEVKHTKRRFCAQRNLSWLAPNSKKYKWFSWKEARVAKPGSYIVQKSMNHILTWALLEPCCLQHGTVVWHGNKKGKLDNILCEDKKCRFSEVKGTVQNT